MPRLLISSSTVGEFFYGLLLRDTLPNTSTVQPSSSRHANKLTNLCTQQIKFENTKRIVSQDFGGLQIILMERTWVPGIPLDVYLFNNSCFK